MVQWLRICLPTQGTKVRSLVGELRSHTMWGHLSPWARTLSLHSLEQQKPVHCSSGEAPMRCNWRKPMHCSEDQHSQTKNRNPWLIVSQWSRRTTGGNSCLILAPRMFVLFLNTRLGPCESYNYSVFPIWLAVTKTWQSSWVRWVNWYPGKFITLILFPCTLS